MSVAYTFTEPRLAKLDGFRVEIDEGHERADIILDRPPYNIVAMPQRVWRYSRLAQAIGRVPVLGRLRYAIDGLYLLGSAWRMARLFRRLDVDNRPVAMLVNFLCPPGSFSFKTAFDEGFAHYSPGVLLQIDNLDILDRPDIAWMDSCAAQDHPMIDSLWTERRAIIRVTVPLEGWRRRIVWALCRALELASARLRRGQDL